MEDTTSLFNYRDPRSMMADRFAAQRQAPSGSLDEMTVQLGGNAGSLIGNALFGGRTSAMAEQAVLNEAIKESEAAEDPDERLSLFANALRKRGLEGYAQKVDAQLQGRMKTRTTAQNAQQRQMALTKLVMDKTGLSPEESAAVAQDEVAVRKLLENDATFQDIDGKVKLVDKKGNVIKVMGSASDKRTTVNVTSNVKTGGGVVDLLQGTQNLTKAELEMRGSAQTAKQLINQAASSNNSQSWEAARTQIAKAVGEGKLSNEDIRRTGVDPRLIQGALDWVNKKVEGVPNQDIMKQLYAVATILEQTSTQRINKKMNAARTVAVKESGLTEETAGTLFPDVDASTGAVEWSQMTK